MPRSPPPRTAAPMTSRLTPMSAPTNLTIFEIKVEPEAESRAILPLPTSQATPIPASTPITSATPTTPTTPIPYTPILAPTFTPTGVSTPARIFTPIPSSTPAPAQKHITPTPVSNSRRPGRQGRPPKERSLTKNKPVEVINYPCHEQLSDFNHQKLLELNVYPTDGVSKYSRSIPFKGAKESFLKRTGRNRFDVFEYRFTAPNAKGEDKYWWVMWDYYNGLVRVHDFFDCCKPGKTEPGNAVKEKINPGLQQVCHNITGGNLHAQGYWIPYPAAKALAAKFCFRIRFALTIIFGDDFPSLCLPETHPDFGKYAISPEVINACQESSARQYDIEQQRIIAGSPRPRPRTPSNFSSRVSTAASSSAVSSASRASPASQTSQTGRPGSVTPGKTPNTSFFDPVRGGYTNGSSNNYNSSRSCQPNKSRPASSPIPVKAPTTKKQKVEKNTKARRSGNSSASDTTSSTVPLALHAQTIPFFPATRSIYFPESSMRGTQQAKSPTISKRAAKDLMVLSSRYPTQVGGTVPIAVAAPPNRHPTRDLLVGNSSSSPLVGDTTSFFNPRAPVTSSRKAQKVSAPLLPPIEDIGSEYRSHQPSKKAKVSPSEPDRYNNPYMNPIRFAIGTFQTGGPRSSRDGSLPEIQRPFTRERYEELVSSQIEESAEDLLAAEAAANLMALQRRDYERDFSQGQNLRLKRRRSN